VHQVVLAVRGENNLLSLLDDIGGILEVNEFEGAAHLTFKVELDSMSGFNRWQLNSVLPTLRVGQLEWQLEYLGFEVDTVTVHYDEF